MSTVAEILRRKGPVFNFVEANTLVIHALESMKARNLSYLVVRKNNEYVGIISERDYAQKIILMGKSSDTTTVEEIMSTDLPFADVEATDEECMVLMNNLQTRYLPVFENLKFRGVITIHDLLRQTLRSKKEKQLNQEVLVY